MSVAIHIDPVAQKTDVDFDTQVPVIADWPCHEWRKHIFIGCKSTGKTGGPLWQTDLDPNMCHGGAGLIYLDVEPSLDAIFEITKIMANISFGSIEFEDFLEKIAPFQKEHNFELEHHEKEKGNIHVHVKGSGFWFNIYRGFAFPSVDGPVLNTTRMLILSLIGDAVITQAAEKYDALYPQSPTPKRG